MNSIRKLTSLRLRPDNKEKLEKIAEYFGRSMRAHIEFLIERDIETNSVLLASKKIKIGKK